MKNTSDRFLDKVKKTKTCWIWTGAKSWNGYGGFYFNNKYYRAHRYSWEVYNGKIPKGKFVLHKCDNKKCVNPEHLFLGTHQDNMDDMVMKGRQAFGENHGNRKLTIAQVLQIKKIHKSEKISHKKLALRFNTGRSTITDILSGKTWKCVN